MILTFCLTVIIGVVLTALTAKFKRFCGIIAVLTVLVIDFILINVIIKVFNSAEPLTVVQPLFSIPTIGASLLISIDKMSAMFLILIGLVSLIATLYSIRYMDVYNEENLVRFYPFLILFIVGMIGVVCVSDLFFFFVFWEFMTLVSYFLVIYEKEQPDVLRAGFKYFLMTHIGTALMFISGLVLQSVTGSFSFSNIQQAIENMANSSPFVLHILLALFFIGFATKAGVYPFGTWLPDAHPAAPSGISAILSGIMIKMGIYGILRVFLFMVPLMEHTNIATVWGVIISSFGIMSIVIGTFGALNQQDYKKLFAYSSIAQIGYILFSLGVGITLINDNLVIASIAIIAGIFHMVNHAFFKSLLFLNAGSIFFKSGTRDMNETGGLASIMPFTTITSLIGTMSIIGFPLFSGFVSKFLIYEASILGGIKFPIYILYGVISIFFAVLTMAYCIKFLGLTFYGTMPSKLTRQVKEGEVPFSMNLSQGILAFICVLFGIIPLLPLGYIYNSVLIGSKIANVVPTFNSLFGSGKNGVSILFNGTLSGLFRPVFIGIAFLVCLVFSYFVFKSGGASKRIVPAWYCGEEYNPDHLKYRGYSFYLSIMQILNKWFLPVPSRAKEVKETDIIYKMLDFDRLFYYPFVEWIYTLTRKLRKTHVGIPQVYMLWQAAGIIIVILILFLFAK